MRKRAIILLLLATVSLLLGCSRGSSFYDAGGGLLVRDDSIGSGPQANPYTTVSVHYKGWLFHGGKKGSKFDSSGWFKPFSFTLGQGQVIQGWDQGLMGMRVGGKRSLIIPPELAYGDRSVAKIPAGSTLYFEVELVSVS